MHGDWDSPEWQPVPLELPIEEPNKVPVRRSPVDGDAEEPEDRPGSRVIVIELT